MRTKMITLLVAALTTGLVFLAQPCVSEAQGRDSVMTRLRQPFGVSGEMHAMFVATPSDDGAWNVDARFHFHDSSFALEGQPGVQHFHIQGSAEGTITCTPGVSSTLLARGTAQDSRGPDNPIILFCTFTIGSDGVVSVSSIHVPR